MSIFFLILILACNPSTKPADTTRTTAFQAGAASAVVNPPLGAFIAGDKQNRRFTGILDSLYAKAVVWYDGKTALAIVTVDCIGLLYPEVNKIRQRATELTKNIPLPASNVIISSTHTHSGPDVVGLWGKDYQHSGVDSVYLDFLIETAATQVSRAAQQLQPASVRYAETQFGDAWLQNICKEEIDRSVTILQITNKQGKNIASLTNFACHPTYLDAKFSQVSADYVAGFYRTMNRQLGGENLFLQGAIGGWVQPVDGEVSPEKAYRRGDELAAAALNSLQQSKRLTDSQLQIKTLPIRFKLENPAWQQLAAIGTIRRAFTDSVTTEVAWFAIGEAQFATHPGETAPFFGLETKKMMPTEGPKFVLGLSMDALGYILKPVYFDDATLPHAPYLTSMSVGKPTGPDLMRSLREVIPKSK
jgi:hypothetical protein